MGEDGFKQSQKGKTKQENLEKNTNVDDEEEDGYEEGGGGEEEMDDEDVGGDDEDKCH